MRIYQLLVLVVAASICARSQSIAPIFSWTTIPNAYLGKYIETYERGMVVFSERVGIFGGHDLDSLVPLLNGLQFSMVEGHTTVKSLRNGALLVAGAPGDGYYVRESSNDTLRWILRTALGGPLPGGQTRPTTEIRSFEPNAFHAYHAYSVNSGAAWIRVMPPDTVAGWKAITYGKNEGFFAKDAERGTWYHLDLAEHRWDTTDIPTEINDFVFLNNGAVVAIGEMPEYRPRLYMRASVSLPWSEIKEFVRADGDTVPVDQMSGVFPGTLIVLDDSTAVIGFDRGVVAVLNGSTVNVHSVPEGYTRFLTTIASTGSDTVLLVYRDQFVVLDIRTGERTVVQQSRIPLSSLKNSILYDNSIVVLDNTGSTILWEYDLGRRTWRLSGRIILDHETVRPISTGSITSHGGHVLARVGSLTAVECDTIATVLQDLSRVSAEYLSASFEMKYGARRFVSTGNGLLHLGSRALSKVGEDSTTTLFRTAVACAYWEQPERLWIGGDKVYRSQDSGVTWMEIDLGEGLREDSSTVSSVIAASDRSLVIGRRGYTTLLLTEPTDTVRGGILISDDQRTTWTKVPLPVEGEWVESIARVEEGCLLAWVSDMNREVGSIDTQYAHGAWNLLKSCDDGRTWSVVLTRSYNHMSATPGSWCIATSGRDIAVSASDRVFVSRNSGDTWQEQTRLPLNTSYNSLAYDDMGMLWIGSDKGIYRIQPAVSVDDTPGLRQDEGPQITLSPNPSTETIRLKVPAESFPVSTLWIVDARGRVVADLTKDVQCLLAGCDDMPVDISRLDPGAYFFVLHHVARATALKFVKR